MPNIYFLQVELNIYCDLYNGLPSLLLEKNPQFGTPKARCCHSSPKKKFVIKLAFQRLNYPQIKNYQQIHPMWQHPNL